MPTTKTPAAPKTVKTTKVSVPVKPPSALAVFGKRIKKLAVPLFVLATALTPSAAKAAVTPETLTDDHVVAAIEKGIDWLFSKKTNGTWEDQVWKWDADKGVPRVYNGGHTAIVLYSLMHVSQSLKDKDDPRLGPRAVELQEAIKYVTKIDSDLSYLKAAQIMALCQVSTLVDVKKALPKAATPMISAMRAQGYTYRYPPRGNDEWDNSSTQLSLLAAWGLPESGVEVPIGYWKLQDAYWRKHQLADGGWGYRQHKDGDQSRASLTAAGVASLFITNEHLKNYTGLKAIKDPEIDKGFAWLDNNLNPGAVDFNGEPSGYWILYAAERAAQATGRKYIGGKDWYREGAAALINAQEADGRWDGKNVFNDTRGGYVPTSLALLFLARGRNPVAFNKLEYAGDTWNARPYDLAHLTQWLGRQLERAINWQTVSFASPPDEWMDAPVLLITGSADPKFTDVQIAKLRAFVEQGGMIFSTADGGNATPFTRAMLGYAAKLANNQYEPRELPPEHPIYSNWDKIKGNLKLTGLSNGAREVWVHSPVDLGATWQRHAYATADHFTLPANAYFYAAGGASELVPRLRSLKIQEVVGAPAITTKVARVEFVGNWNPEPGAWRRFAKLMRVNAETDMTVDNVKVEDLDPAKHKVAHLTGTEGFKLAEVAVAKLKAYVAAGGTLIIDPCGGSEKTVTGATDLAVLVCPGGTLEGIGADNAVLAGSFPGGAKIEKLVPRRNVISANRRGDRVQGIKVGDRYGVIVTSLDVTSGLLGTNTQGIAGFSSDTSFALMRNLVLYGISEKKASAAAAAAGAEKK